MTIYESAMQKCHYCGNITKWKFNWVHGDDGRLYHECMECENVMVTDEKVVETNEVVTLQQQKNST